MKLTASDLYELGICDRIIPEPAGGAQSARDYIFDAVEREIAELLKPMLKISGTALAKERYRKLRNVGNFKRKAEQTEHGQELKPSVGKVAGDTVVTNE